jgi:hypothetical protein
MQFPTASFAAAPLKQINSRSRLFRSGVATTGPVAGEFRGAIPHGKTIHHDLGVIEHAAGDARQMKYMLNVAGAAFDAHIDSSVKKG